MIVFLEQHADEKSGGHPKKIRSSNQQKVYIQCISKMRGKDYFCSNLPAKRVKNSIFMRLSKVQSEGQVEA